MPLTDWQERSLGEIADITMGQAPPGSSYNSDGTGVPFIQGAAEFGSHHPEPRNWCTAPTKVARVDVPRQYLDFIDRALQGVTREGTMAWKMGGFPLDQVTVRAKTGSAEVYGKQSTGWVASYTKDYVVVMMISQAGTGSGSTGEGIRAIWEALYGIDGETVRPARSAIPGTVPPGRLPTFTADGSIVPPRVRD